MIKIAVKIIVIARVNKVKPKPIEVECSEPTKKITLKLRSKGILHLRNIVIHGPTKDTLSNAEYRLSSSHKSSGKAQDLTIGKWIHTNSELEPFWEVEFKKHENVFAIDVYNRLGQWGHRTYDLTIEINGLHRNYVFDNLSINVIEERKNNFIRRSQEAISKIRKSTLNKILEDEIFEISKLL